MKDDSLLILDILTEMIALSGDERRLSSFIKQTILPHCDEVIYDNLGSLYGVKKSTVPHAPKVMVSGYIDESGFIVKELLENGMIQALAIGTHSHLALHGAKIVLINNDGTKYNGTIILGEGQSSMLSQKKDCLIDCGFSSKQALKEAHIDFGDSITFATKSFLSTNKSHYYGKALGRSYGCLQIITLLNNLEGVSLPFDLYAGVTVLNQVGNRGAQTATNLVVPDLAITFDVLPSNDTVTPTQTQGILGKGPLLTYYDKSILPNKALTHYFKESCTKESIVLQPYYSLTGSDAGWIHKLRLGTPTLLINIAGANLGTPISVINCSDLEKSLHATSSLIKHLSIKDITSFKKENR